MDYSKRYISNYQIPLRLPDDLANELHEVSEATGIQKTKLCRMGLERLMTDMKANRIAETMRTITRNDFNED